MTSWHSPRHALHSLTLEICSVVCAVFLSPGEKDMLRDEYKPDGIGGCIGRGEKKRQIWRDMDWFAEPGRGLCHSWAATNRYSPSPGNMTRAAAGNTTARHIRILAKLAAYTFRI
ncbi:uncharacterized [Tachysurus ichikawai]